MANYNVAHIGLNSVILTSENKLDTGSIFVGVDNGFLEKVARWEFNTPNEVEFRPIKPIVEISESVEWFGKLYEILYNNAVNNNDILIDVTSVKRYVSRITFDKKFSEGSILPIKSLYTSFELVLFPKDNYGKLRIVSSLEVSHHLWGNSKTEATENFETVEFLQTIKNKLAYLLQYSHLTATDATELELQLMEYYLEGMLDSV